MKAIINGLRYDTDKAICIGQASHGEGSRDFSSWEAGLYKTPRSGRYFLAGSGGPMSRYSRSIGENNTSGSERIDPMTKDEALKWAEKYLTAEEIEVGFADAIEDA